MKKPVQVSGPYIEATGLPFITVDDETNIRWLREDVATCRARRKDIRRRADEEVKAVIAEQRALESQLAAALPSNQGERG